ncbi:MAG: hypothetical protein PUE01_03465, partial [Clostridiaceae bacterium]|nr:hypothetical protein [Clostridiaceae bacterium]
SLESDTSSNLTVEDKANTYDKNIIKSDIKKSNIININNNHDGNILSNVNSESSSKNKRINNSTSIQHKDESNKKEIANSNADKVDTFIKPLLNKHKIKFIDNRSKKGAFWVLGGLELNNIMKNFGQYGFVFIFKKQGGRASKNMPAWYLSKY